jgi:hypothetical protein
MKHPQPARRDILRDQERLVALAGKEDVRQVHTAGLDRELLAAFPDFTGRELGLLQAFDRFRERR